MTTEFIQVTPDMIWISKDGIAEGSFRPNMVPVIRGMFKVKDKVTIKSMGLVFKWDMSKNELKIYEDNPISKEYKTIMTREEFEKQVKNL